MLSVESLKLNCVKVANGSGLRLTVLDAGRACCGEIMGDSFCICRFKRRADVTLSEGNFLTAEAGDILFCDNRELLCRDNTGDGAAEVICLDMQVFNICNFGLLGERVAAFFRFLAGTHYCHKAASPDHAELENARRKIWLQRNSASDSVTETVMAALWSIAALLKDKVEVGQSVQTESDWRSKTRLMPLLLYLQENYACKISLTDMAGIVNMSVPNFSAVFRKTMGVPPIEFLIRLRVQNAAYQILNTDKKIIDIAEDCGFTSISNFIKAFRKYYGASPVQYRLSGSGTAKVRE